MKKKIFILSLIIILCGVSSVSFAAVYGYLTDSLTLGTVAATQLIIKTSKNVAMRVEISDPANAGDPAINYLMSSYHQNGNRTFATSNQDQKLYFQSGTGLTGPACPTDAVTLPSWGTWSPL
jgi:hypothetical protein